MENYIYILIYAVILIVGLINYKKFSHNVLLKLWFCFLIYSFLTEIASGYMIVVAKVSPAILHNTWFILNALFYMLFYLFRVHSKVRKQLILSFIALFLISFSIQLFYMNYSKEYFVYSWIIGQLFVAISIIILYVELLNSSVVLTIQKSLFFWISFGVLVFNIILIPVFIVKLIDWNNAFNYMIFVANMVLASSFITGFIMSKKEFNN